MKIYKFAISVLVSVFIVVGILSAYGYWYTLKPRIVQREIYLNDLPREFDGTKVVFMSDIHLGPWRDQSWLRDMVDEINGLKPDMVMLGGDYVEQGSQYVEPAFEELARLQTAEGVYGVMGNHDYLRGPQITPQAMRKAGIQYMDNRGVWIERGDAKLRIAGVGDMYYGQQLYGQALGDSKPEDAVILLSHQPDYFMELPDGRVDLMLAGHLHGGQVTVFGLWAPIFPSRYGQRFLSGWAESSTTKMLISNGVGTFRLPIRLFAEPHIEAIILRSGQEQSTKPTT